jgi:septum site-determining protein MinC
VNPGAEIVASGNIVVWGRLKGMVHAGSDGNENAVVCALEMQPTLLRIAEVIAQPPLVKGSGYPATAYILNGQVVVDAWSIERKEYGS